MKRHYLKKASALLLSMLLLAGCTNSKDITDNPKANAENSNSSSSIGDSDTAEGSTVTPASIDPEVAVTFDSDDYYHDEISSEATVITLNNTTVKVDGPGAAVQDNIITISAEGNYVISGTLQEGQLVVDAGDKDDIRLILNGMSLHCPDSAAMYIKNADKVILSLVDGTVNTLSDGESYQYPDASTDEPNAVIFSKSDLLINGSGSLTVEANYNNAIVSKDDLKITDSNLDIKSVDDGILGRDMVAASNAVITIQAGGDGIKSTNDEDPSKGFILLEGGSFQITTGTEGKAGTSSAKGIKAYTAVSLSGGTFLINSSDDSIHSNGSITIKEADIDIASGDDGIHADSMLTILSGTINITKSYEGLESALILMEGGDVRVKANDDGINAAGGAGSSSDNGRMGPNPFESTGNYSFTINGGYLYIDADGDGLDSNGSIYMTGGTVIVNGPTNNGNGPLDYQVNFEISGGTLIAAGSSGMAQAPDETSTQYSIGVLFTQTLRANTLVNIQDSSGATIATFAPAKDIASFVISSPQIKNGETYTVYTGGSSTGEVRDGYYTGGIYQNGSQMVEFTLSDLVTWVNEDGITNYSGGFGGGGFGGGGFGGGGFGGGGDRGGRRKNNTPRP